MLWSIILSIIISVSGLRKFLDPASQSYVEALGWIPNTLHLISNITVPLALFSNGVWMYGKRLATRPGRVASILLLKFILLPCLQAMCAKVRRV